MCEPFVETQQTYDLITAEYAKQNAATWPRLVGRISVLGASLPPGSVVADVGCGPGRDVTLLRAQGFRVIGIDLSWGQLRTSGLPGVAQADMRQLPLRTGSADAIWCQAALLHIPRLAVPAVLAEFARAVRPGGELYVSVTEGDGEGFEVASRYGSDRKRWFTLHREPELTALLTTVGFAVHQTHRNRGHGDWLSVHARRLGESDAATPCAANICGRWRASYFPDCGSFRIPDRKGRVNCQGNTRLIRLSSGMRRPGSWSSRHVLSPMWHGNSESVRPRSVTG